MHIINPHRRHTNRALTLKCIARIWTSGRLSVDCYLMSGNCVPAPPRRVCTIISTVGAYFLSTTEGTHTRTYTYMYIPYSPGPSTALQ